MIRNLIFDFGNVLVHYEYESFFRSLVQVAPAWTESSSPMRPLMSLR